MTTHEKSGKEDDVQETTEQRERIEETIKREQRRIRIWAGVAVALWVAAAGYCVANILFFLTLFYPKLVEYMLRSEETMDSSFLRILADYLLYSNILWPVLLVAAGVCTILFILKSRRATLQQIQVHLAQISQQLKKLAQE